MPLGGALGRQEDVDDPLRRLGVDVPAPSVRTFASLCSRAFLASASVLQVAARTPGTLLAAIAEPIPAPSTTIPKFASPWATRSAGDLGEDRVVDRLLSVRAAVADLVTVARQVCTQPLLELEAAVVGAEGDSQRRWHAAMIHLRPGKTSASRTIGKLCGDRDAVSPAALKVVSGGQTGVDRAALDVALKLGLPCGGWCPRGRRAEDGRIPERYPLSETPSSAYPQRTEWNVRDSDATLILTCGRLRGGTALTARIAERLVKPCLVVDLECGPAAEEVAAWIRDMGLRVVNVAGPRESENSGLQTRAAAFLSGALTSVTGSGPGSGTGSGSDHPSGCPPRKRT